METEPKSRSRSQSPNFSPSARHHSRSPSPSPSSSSSSSSRSPSPSRRHHHRHRSRDLERSTSPPPQQSSSPPHTSLSSAASPSRSNNNDNDGGQQQQQQQRKEKSAEVEEQEEKGKTVFASKDDELLSKFRTGGVYIPPFKLAQLRQRFTDKGTKEYQRLMWDALKKSLNGLINKVNKTNIKNIIPELFNENLVRGRGLLCRALMKAQPASPTFTAVYAALVAVINTKMPEIGSLLVHRIVSQFRRAYQRNDKHTSLALTKFIAHLLNQQVVHEVLALQLLNLYLSKPSDESVELAIGFIKECGYVLNEMSPKNLHAVFERFRGILHEGQITKRVQFMIEELFAIRKSAFKDFVGVPDELDLVEPEDVITHDVDLDEPNLDPHWELDYFHFDPEWEKNEADYQEIKREILGESSDDEEDADTEKEQAGDSSDDDDDEKKEDEGKPTQNAAGAGATRDLSETELTNLRRTIYLTIMSSVDYEECAHKLLKNTLKPGMEMEMCKMIIDCCSQERTYLRFYGLLGQRFCLLSRVYQDRFDECFRKYYGTVHQHETTKLRNVAKFFAHLLYTDGLPWTVLSYIRLNDEDTTSSSRIFIKILFQELAEYMGLAKLNERMKDPYLAQHFAGLFPKDNHKHTRFAINFWTAIGLGGLTDELREHLKNAPKLIMQQKLAAAATAAASATDGKEKKKKKRKIETSSSDSSYSDSSSYSGSSSGSDSGSYSSSSSRSRSRSPSPRRRQSRGHKKTRR